MRDGKLNLDEQRQPKLDSQAQTLGTLCIKLSLDPVTCRFVYSSVSGRNAMRFKGVMRICDGFLLKLWFKLF